MLFNNKLKRKQLVKIMDEFNIEYKATNDKQVKNNLLKRVLLNIESILKKKNLKKDDNFFTYCRREFLKQEFTDKLNKKNIDQYSDYLIDAYYNLYDYISNDTWISLSSIPSDLSAKDVISKNDEYRKKGFICLQEKEILLEMICELQKAIKEEA